MNPERNPLPLIDPRADTPECVRTVLSAGRADLPSPAALARLAGKVLPSGGGSGGSAGSGGQASAPVVGAAPSAAAPWLLPGLLGGVATVVVTVSALLLWARPPAHAPGAPLDKASPVHAEANAPPPANPDHPTPGPGSAGDSAPGDSAPAGDSAPTGESAPADDSTPAPDRHAGGAASGASPSPRPPSSGRVTPSPAAPKTSPKARGDNRSPPPGAAATPPLTPAAEKESALLLRAREALASSPAGALALADEHRARYPGGMLAQEREMIAVSALVALGRAADAKARAATFTSAYPRSAHRLRVESLVRGAGE